jgi:hypothetical protein
MIEMESNHCEIVARSLADEREVDEQTFASLAILTERLEHLKKLDKAYSGVKFSSSVRKLQARRDAVAIG